MASRDAHDALDLAESVTVSGSAVHNSGGGGTRVVGTAVLGGSASVRVDATAAITGTVDAGSTAVLAAKYAAAHAGAGMVLYEIGESIHAGLPVAGIGSAAIGLGTLAQHLKQR